MKKFIIDLNKRYGTTTVYLKDKLKNYRLGTDAPAGGRKSSVPVTQTIKQSHSVKTFYSVSPKKDSSE